MKRIYFIFFLLAFSLNATASHYRAGEITYAWLGGMTYRITVTTFTNTCSTMADDVSVTVYFSDQTNVVANRIVNATIATCFQKNVYDCYKTFNGPYTYRMWIEQPNRKAGILNMSDPLNTPFYIESWININPMLGGGNNSPVLLYPPLDSACIGVCFTHNPLAYDPDGDSLSYTIANCLTTGGVPAMGYYIPSGTTVDPLTGDLTWCTPQPNGNFYPQCYNFAMIIQEWRKDLNGVWNKVGWVERDLEVDVFNNCNNQAPVVTANDACVEAGQLLTINVSASDPDPGDLLTLSAAGGPFTLTPLPVFTTPPQPQASPASGTFSWSTTCDLIRKYPYQVQFKAQDNATPVSLSGFKSVFITVIAPAPGNLRAQDTCSSIILNWDAAVCNPPSNPLKGYYIYRSTQCRTWNPASCENGVPPYTGYVLIGSTTSTTFTDAGLSYGVTYSYRVTAYYNDGAESYSSNPVCLILRQAVPVLTHVDVVSTGSSDTIRVKWVKPLGGANGLDTIRHAGPYRYELFRGIGYTGTASTFVASYSSPTFSGLTIDSLIDVGLQTAINPYFYRIDFYANDTLICSNHMASSVYLSLTPSDNQVTLSWSFNVPWSNYSYEVYRSIPSLSIPFTYIGTTNSTSYLDLNLVNGRTYCYKVKAIGKYSDPSLPTPLINWSEEKCAAPIDLIAPCAPSLTISSDCDAGINHLQWNNPNLTCADDVVAYNIFYTPTVNGDYQFLGTVTGANITTFLHDSLISVAGCYVIAAVDSFNNQSAFSNKACVDNCPVYELPNVFTPNGDGVNDYFIPFPYRYVKDIELKIFNRWGALVFTSTDPDINWNGKEQQTGVLCSDGVYYFTCQVNEIRLEGIQPRMISGFVQILGGK